MKFATYLVIWPAGVNLFFELYTNLNGLENNGIYSYFVAAILDFLKMLNFLKVSPGQNFERTDSSNDLNHKT